MTTLFETPRLRIRPYVPEDAAAAFEIYGDAEVVRFIGGRQETSVESTASTLERIIDRYSGLGGFGFWAVEEKDSGRVVGSVILKPLPESTEIEVGWHLARRVWGRGYATEAGRACLEYGFRALGLRRIVAVVDARNERSLAVARRLEMRHEGQVYLYGADLELFALEDEGA